VVLYKEIGSIYTESEQSLYRIFGICEFITAVPFGITETKRQMRSICLKFQYIKFLSREPLLTSLKDINLFEIDWVIAGGESGSEAHPIKKDWIVEIKDMCEAQKYPFLF